MKPIKCYLLYLSVICTMLITGCQEEEVATFKIPSGRPNPGDKAPNPLPTLIPPSEVIIEEYTQATSWTVTWNHPYFQNRYALASIFNTNDGTFHSYNSLNASGQDLTAKADMALLFGKVTSVENHTYLEHKAFAPATRFKPSSMTVLGFINATQNNPHLFKEAFEDHTYEPTHFQPYNYEANGGDNVYYQSGEIYLFQTDQTPARYGAIRIIEGSDIVGGTIPRVIQIVLYNPVFVEF